MPGVPTDPAETECGNLAVPMEEMVAATNPAPAGSGDAAPVPAAPGRIGVVGAGVMAEAMVAGWLRRGLVQPQQVTCSHPRPERREELRHRYGVEVVGSNASASRAASIVALTVKPQMLPRVLPELRGTLTDDALVLSIVAGASTASIRAGLGHSAVVRAMPNTPAQIGSGVTVWYATPDVNPGQRELADLLLHALGVSVEVEDELQVAMATALSGTGPTYAFLFAEALIEAGVHLGFPRHLARTLVWDTLRGSVDFAVQSGEHPARLRDMVTSPGGTSAEALAALERGRFRTVVGDAVWAAYRRTKELETGTSSAGGPPTGPGASGRAG